ncbi:MAG: ELWxxDGT repeat protein [Bacteroidota bacterium]
MAVVDGILLFSATDGTNGTELWKSDGTTAGTVMIEDVEPGAGSSTPTAFVDLNGKLLVTFNTSAYGQELWLEGYHPIPIPLTLLQFKGSILNDQALLEWKTAAEVDTKNFIIEKSSDGFYFYSIGTVSAFNQNGVHDYTFRDESLPGEGAVVYYRLKQVDIDERFTYSNVIRITVTNRRSSADLYPNPVKDVATLQVSIPHAETIGWELIDNSGKILQDQTLSLQQGKSYVTINTSGLIPGLYYIQVKSTQVRQFIKLVKY